LRNNTRNPLYILVPVHNEEKTVYRVLENILHADISEFNLGKQIILVDDGSTDRTLEQIEKFQKDHPDAPIILRRMDQNLGKGSAIREGLAYCQKDEGIVIIQDGDLEYSPDEYPILLKPLAAGLTRVVYGSRWIYAGPMSKSGWLYTLGGWLENQYLKMLYRCNISDVATCYKVMPAGLMKALDLESTGFEFCPEVTAKLLNRGETILEVPITYRARKKKEGKKIKWTDFFIAIYTLTRLRFMGDKLKPVSGRKPKSRNQREKE